VVRDSTIEAVVAVLAALVSEGPLVLVVDDAQWATGEQLGAVTHLANEVLGAVLFVTVGRSDLLTSTWWDRMPDVEVLPVQPLDAAASERLLRAYLSGAELDAETRALLLDRAQGNPFFLAELLHLLVDRGLLRREGEGWRLTGGLPRNILPAGVQAVLAARIDGLPVAARTLLRDASVLGNRFTPDMLRSLEPLSDGEDPVAPALEELVARGIVQATGGVGDPAPHYMFTHALTRDVAYASIPKGERARRHATVARWALAGLHWSAGETDALVAAQAEQAVELAEEMGLPPDDIAWSAREIGFGALDRLGEAALARDDNERAEGLLSRALDLAGEHVVPSAAVARAQVRRAAARVALHRFDDAERDLKGPLESRDLRIRSAALVVRGEILRRSGDEPRAREALVSALAAASESGYDRVAGEALRQLGLIDYVSGRLTAADERFEQALNLAERVGDRRGAGWALQHLAWNATTRGDYVDAERRLAAAADVFAGLDDDGGLSWCAGTEAFVRLLQGRLEQARDLAQGLLPLGRALGDRWGTAACLTIDALAAAELGQISTALEESAAAYDDFKALGDTWGVCLASIGSGIALRGAGRLRKAIRRLEHAAELAERSHQPVPQALAMSAIGYCRLDLGDFAAAEAAANRALETIAPLDVRPAALVGMRVLRAQALRARGDAEAALPLLREAQQVDDGSLAFPRRQALAHLAGVLLELGEEREALAVAHQAMATPAQDLRSRIVTLRVLGACLAAVGDLPAARFAVRQALALSGATEMRAELGATQKALDALG
jgi:tetratricopeptide (TPR) repeat protein